MNQITVFQAINQMRKLSAAGETVAFTFMTFSQTTGKSSGIKEVRRARLKNRTNEADFLNAEMIEEYVDMDSMESRRFYQPLLMSFNGQKVELK